MVSKLRGARVKVSKMGDRRRRSRDPVDWPNGGPCYCICFCICVCVCVFCNYSFRL